MKRALRDIPGGHIAVTWYVYLIGTGLGITSNGVGGRRFQLCWAGNTRRKRGLVATEDTYDQVEGSHREQCMSWEGPEY
jgi:hypothetical protein